MCEPERAFCVVSTEGTGHSGAGRLSRFRIGQFKSFPWALDCMGTWPQDGLGEGMVSWEPDKAEWLVCISKAC